MSQQEITKLQEDWAAAIKANVQVAHLNADLQEEVDALKKLLRPFAESFRLHKDDDRRVASMKHVLSMDTSLEDWKAAFEALYGPLPEKVEEES